ncbi:MAG TPA: hypothetical protein VNX25_03035, partial [Verrucomicrobiae bacterium]|nr:hypothetical protein [Verrucomicrobiae bacterium]
MLRGIFVGVVLAGGALTAACGTTGGGEATPFSHACAATCHDGHATAVAAAEGSSHAANGVTCKSCHGDWRHSSCDFCHSAGNVSQSSMVNPDSAGVCATCHAAKLGAPHFQPFTTANGVYPAAYVSDRNVNACRNCHSIHLNNFKPGLYREYAISAHADTAGQAWTANKWKDASRYQSCQRCHTTSGFIAHLSGTTATFGPGNNQVLDCTACHADNAFAFRPAGAVTVPYGATLGGKTYTATVSFPDLGASNLCLNCHTGRVAGGVVAAIADAGGSFTSLSFGPLQSHHLP